MFDELPMVKPSLFTNHSVVGGVTLELSRCPFYYVPSKLTLEVLTMSLTLNKILFLT